MHPSTSKWRRNSQEVAHAPTNLWPWVLCCSYISLRRLLRLFNRHNRFACCICVAYSICVAAKRTACLYFWSWIGLWACRVTGAPAHMPTVSTARRPSPGGAPARHAQPAPPRRRTALRSGDTAPARCSVPERRHSHAVPPHGTAAPAGCQRTRRTAGTPRGCARPPPPARCQHLQSYPLLHPAATKCARPWLTAAAAC